MIFSWARFFIALAVGGFFLIPLDLFYTSMRAAFVGFDAVTYSGVYMNYADSWIHWMPLILIIGGLVGLYVDSKMRQPQEVFM